jgi:hypothetical protein
MSFANRLTGKNLWVGWIDASGTVTLTGDQTAFSPDIDQRTVDMSAGSDAMRSYRAALKDFSATLELFNAGAAGTAMLRRVKEGSEGTLLWAPEGTATGKAKWGLAALVSKVSLKYPFDDAAKITIEFKPQSDLIYDGRSDTW